MLRSSLEMTGYSHSQYCLFPKHCYEEEPRFLVIGLDNQITKLS